MEELKEELSKKIDSAETLEELEVVAEEIDKVVEEQPKEETEKVEEVVEEVVDEKVEEEPKDDDKKDDKKDEVEEISKEEERSLLANAVANEKISQPMEERKMENIYATKEYRSAFLNKLRGKELTVEERAAMSTATTSAGYAIPTETLDRIEEVLKADAPLYKEIEVLNIAGYLDIPVESTVNDASWIAEGSVSTDSADVIGKISFVARKLIKTIAITAEVEAMAIDAFEAWLVEKLGAKLAQAIDNGVLNGAGAASNQMVGICNDNDVTSYTATINYAGITTAISKLKYTNDAKMVMNRKTLWTKVATILDGANRPVFMTSAVDGLDGKVLGFDVIVDDNCADNTIVIGNFKKYTVNFNKPISIDKDASVDFRYGNVVYRGMALVDGHVVNKNAFVVLKETASA